VIQIGLTLPPEFALRGTRPPADHPPPVGAPALLHTCRRAFNFDSLSQTYLVWFSPEQVDTMYCAMCGYQIPEGGQFCPGCGTKIEKAKASGVVEDVGQKTVDLTKKAVGAAKPVAKGAARLTGRAIAKVGSLTERAGKKLKESTK